MLVPKSTCAPAVAEVLDGNCEYLWLPAACFGALLRIGWEDKTCWADIESEQSRPQGQWKTRGRRRGPTPSGRPVCEWGGQNCGKSPRHAGPGRAGSRGWQCGS